MTNPVAPVVTDKMVDIAEIAYDNEADLTNTDYENRHFCYRGPLRAAITAALEASGELERLRTALAYYAAPAGSKGGPWQSNSTDYGRVARTALEGGTV